MKKKIRKKINEKKLISKLLLFHFSLTSIKPKLCNSTPTFRQQAAIAWFTLFLCAIVLISAVVVTIL